jgi:hypothetical protein
MGKVFLDSLATVMKDAAPLMWLDTMGCQPHEVDELKNYYPRERLHIVNRKLPMRDWAAQIGIPLGELKEYKRQCEQRYVSNKNRVWKLMVAGDHRVKSLRRLLFMPDLIPHKDTPDWDTTVNFVAHFDIDTLFRRPLNRIPEMMEKADIWLKLRPNNPIVKARITIDVILVKPTDRVRDFFNRWVHYINRIPPKQRPLGYGQTSCWLAFEEVKDRLNYASLPLPFGLPGRNKPSDIIWTGNKHKLRKDDCAKMFAKELENAKSIGIRR